MVSSTPRPHFTPGKDRVPILQEAGWASGPVCTDGKSRPHRDSISDRPARSQSLYRLSYRAHNLLLCVSETRGMPRLKTTLFRTAATLNEIDSSVSEWHLNEITRIGKNVTGKIIFLCLLPSQRIHSQNGT